MMRVEMREVLFAIKEIDEKGFSLLLILSFRKLCLNQQLKQDLNHHYHLAHDLSFSSSVTLSLS